MSVCVCVGGGGQRSLVSFPPPLDFSLGGRVYMSPDSFPIESIALHTLVIALRASFSQTHVYPVMFDAW